MDDTVLWNRLVDDGNFKLIELLAKAERKEPGYRTVIVPRRSGFSNDDRTHNGVIRWLQKKHIPFLNHDFEIGNLQLALKEGLQTRNKVRKAYGLTSSNR